MPEESVWPLVLAAAIAVVFVGLIVSSNVTAIAGVLAVRDRARGLASPRSARRGRVSRRRIDALRRYPPARAAGRAAGGASSA